MRIRLANSEITFSAAPEQSLLDAALNASLNLPHSCKGGNCGSCRARLLQGEVHYPNGLPLGISTAEAAEGFVLLCQCRACCDLTIETLQITPADQARVKRLPARIERSELLSHDVMALFLRLPAAEAFNFEAGQYLDVMLPGGRRRSFSIASPPHDSRLLELHVRKVDGGEFSAPLFEHAARSALLSIEGPLGQFFYRESAAPMLLIGGGTGIAPLLSILRHVVETGLARDLKIYWGVRSERDLYARATLEALAGYVPVLSEGAPAWTGRRGWVHEAVLEDIPDLQRYDVYAAGPPAMIGAVRREFTLRGVAVSRLYFDSFDYAPDALDRQRSNAATKS